MPALDADIRLVAARTDFVIVGQINIEDKFFGEGAESGFGKRFTVARVSGVHRADFEARGVEAENLFAESNYTGISTVYLESGQILRFKGGECLVAEVSVVLKSKSELSVSKIIGGVGRVVEPPEEVAEGEKALVKNEHHFRV